MKKKIILVVIIIVITTSILLLIKNNSKNKFIGTWKSEGGTIYTFKKNNKGSMKTSLSEYKFTYKIKKNIISIDFENKNAIDTDYEYSFKKGKCTMKSDRGTFVFTKETK